PLSGPGDPRRPPRHLAQPHLLLRSDGRGAAADRGGQLRQMVGKMARRPPSSPTGKPRRDPSRLTRATFSRPKEPVAGTARREAAEAVGEVFRASRLLVARSRQPSARAATGDAGVAVTSKGEHA